ncbi:putative Gpa2-guanine nucleotide-binding protein alpha-2 subunit [Tilletiopsis washingtonensis]|uniref:Putative Gpa2-guanine nucleotide-binding protein alpha-2 subunit n=1 Tax=Tilletiopsis washingtonensis TaxID=58919 RepID=A0A316Z439_9BASI|nr:putative Gpa2-guanine nucleotide-binding protein alpha-2 subunit [Tilletiopsis washingtonensis]PWN95682.1 putative Gpa2-guanine nucleotide-binding protein alpha-2 subunit [Tilletiopsis washingtonensis]
MGNCLSNSAGNDGSPESLKSRQLDRLLRDDEKRMVKEVKLLLLGAGESGKSTILKSMRLIHHIPFTAAEREHYRRLVFVNLVQGMKLLLDAIEEWGGHFEHPEYATFLSLFIAYPDIAEEEPFPANYFEPLRLLWNDAGVQAAHRRGNEAAVPENLTYFFADLDRFFDPRYVPTDSDILRCRNKTTGIIETTFPIDDRMYRILDVGGQRSERKKWVHCFEGVTAVLFLVALSGYDACLVEDRDSNQMQESLMLCDSIFNSKWFARTSMILFLNKVDIFRTKIMYSSVKSYFPDYDGDDQDFNAARNYFKHRFCRLNRSQTKEIYPSFTNATDTGLLKIVMASVTDIILTTSLRDIM